MYSAIVVVIVGIVCLVAGLLVGLWYGKSGQSAEAEKAEAVKNEFGEYREAVNQHFENSAKHFAAIGQEYQALYRHMANGADALLSDDSDVRRSGFPFLPAATDIAADVVDDDTGKEENAADETLDAESATDNQAADEQNAVSSDEAPQADQEETTEQDDSTDTAHDPESDDIDAPRQGGVESAGDDPASEVDPDNEPAEQIDKTPNGKN